MRGFNHIEGIWTAMKARVQDQIGASMVEYTILLAAFAVTVIAGLAFLGGTVGGSFTDVVINQPLADADYGINPHACKKGGWQNNPDIQRTDGGGSFTNQGDCMQYYMAGK
jgi:Flp pilus assembly pilin Flp